jgi:DNA modification methylase
MTTTQKKPSGAGTFILKGCRNIEELLECIKEGKKTPYGRDPINVYNRYMEYKRKLDNGELKIENNGRFPANCITLDENQFYSKYFNVTPKELSKRASPKDRNSDWRGNEINLPPKQGGSLKGTFDKSLKTGSGKERKAFYKNNHPTVKPVPLMEWLVRLITPANGVVLDPFSGSGSTLVAAKREGFNYIGIEKEAEYVEIAKVRAGQR